MKLGVFLVFDIVRDVCFDENGYIDFFDCDKFNVFGDFFIDCIGFKGLLINYVFKEFFILYLDYFVCNLVVVILEFY